MFAGRTNLGRGRSPGHAVGVEDDRRALCGSGLAERSGLPARRDVRGVLTGNEEQGNGWFMGAGGRANAVWRELLLSALDVRWRNAAATMPEVPSVRGPSWPRRAQVAWSWR